MKRPTSISEALRIAKMVKRKKYAWGGGADIPPTEDPRNWLELGGEKPISPTVDQRLGIGTDAGEAIVQPLGGQGMVPAAQNPRINMNFKDVRERVPQLTTAAQKVDAGQMSSKDYQSLVNQHKPVSPWESVPKPATYDELRASLKDKQQPNIGKGTEIPEGHPVGLRLDIPAYTRFGTWAPTIHDRSSSKSTVMAHEPVAMVNNATFTLPQNKAMGVATGTAKNPFATIDGKWSSTTPEQAMALANAAMKNPDWRQVGMDPERHSFFYDRHTQAPIVAAEKVIQVGPLVLAHKPTYGKPEDFKYKNGGGVDEALRLARKRYADGGGTDEIVNVAPPTPLGFLDRIFGKEQPVSYGRATPDQSWPSEADLATSRKYDQTYGSKFAPTVTEGAMIDRPSFAQAQKLYLSKSDTPNLQPVDQEQKDRLETAWLAANKTALGSLGFDPRHIASTPATKEATTVAGFYKPENDKIWYNEKYPSTIIHESLHRGIQELKDAGKLPDWLKSNMEETLVRGMMLKHLGNIEMGRGETGNKQIQYAQNLMEPRMSHGAVWATNHGKSFPNMLTELESLAARHLYEKQPRGPRAAGGRTEAVEIARQRYADGGSPSYGDTAYEQLLRDMAAQKAKALPDMSGLRRDPAQGTAPVPVKRDLGGYEPVDELAVKPPVFNVDTGGGGLSSSYGLPSATPTGMMSSTSTGPSSPAGATPGFSFTGAPIGAVEMSNLPAPTSLDTKSVATTSVAPSPGMFAGTYTGQPAANNSVANQTALGTQIGAQVGNALNTIGSTPAAAPAASAGKSSSPFGALGPGPQSNQAMFDAMGNVAVPGSSPYGAAPSVAAPTVSPSKSTVPGVQAPSFVAQKPFATAEELAPDAPADMMGPTIGGLPFSETAQDQTVSGETGSFGANAGSNGMSASAANDGTIGGETGTFGAAAAPAAPSAPDAPDAPSAPAAATAAPDYGFSISESNLSSDPGLAAALADAQAQADADAAAAADEGDDGDGEGDDEGDDGDGEGDGDGDGEGDGDGDGEGGGGDGGGGEKRGGFIRPHVKKALRLTEKKTKRIKFKPHSASKAKPDTGKIVKTAINFLDRKRGQHSKRG